MAVKILVDSTFDFTAEQRRELGIESVYLRVHFGDEEYHSMICVEAANASVDARTVFPGEKRRISQTVTVL